MTSVPGGMRMSFLRSNACRKKQKFPTISTVHCHWLMFVSLAWAIEASVAYLSGASVGKTNRYHRPLLEQSGVRRPYALLPRPHAKAKAIAMAVASCFVAHGALANPYGLSVVNGQVSARQNGNILSITNSPGSFTVYKDLRRTGCYRSRV